MVKTRGLKKNLAADRQSRSKRRSKSRNEAPAQRLDVMVWEPAPLPVSHSDPSPQEGTPRKRRRLVLDRKPVSSAAVLTEEAVLEEVSREEQATEDAVAGSADERCRTLVMSPGIVGEGEEIEAESPKQESAAAHAPPPSDKEKAPILIPVSSSEEESSEEEEGGDECGKSWVRGKTVLITPEKIDEFLEIHENARAPTDVQPEMLAKVLTGGVCLSWGGPNLSAAELSSKNALLYHLGIRNWIPSSHRGKVSRAFANLLYSIGKKRRISLGSVMFPQLATHAGSASSSKPIVLPSLIYGMMVSQHPELGEISEGLSEELQVFTVDHKLFKGKHAVDIAYEDPLLVGTSAPAPLEESLPPPATIQSALRARIVSHLRSEMLTLEAEAKRRDARRGQIRSLLRDLEFPADEEQAL